MTASGVVPARALSLRGQVKAERTQAILAVARELFYENGFEQTATLEIAERAGVGAGTVFKYFPTKDALLFAVMNADLAKVYRRVGESARAESGLLAQLIALFRPVIEFHLSHIALSRVFVRLLVSTAMTELVEPRADDSPIIATNLAKAFVAEARARGELRHDISVTDLAGNCFAIFLDVLNLALVGDPAIPRPYEDLERRLALQVTPFVSTGPKIRD